MPLARLDVDAGIGPGRLEQPEACTALLWFVSCVGLFALDGSNVQ